VLSGHFVKEFDKCVPLIANTKEFQKDILSSSKRLLIEKNKRAKRLG